MFADCYTCEGKMKGQLLRDMRRYQGVNGGTLSGLYTVPVHGPTLPHHILWLQELHAKRYFLS